MTDERLNRPIEINGINGSTGEPLLPGILTDGQGQRALTWQDLLDNISGENDDLYKLSEKRIARPEESMGPIARVDPNKLEEAGWGIIYAPSITEQIKEALSPLVNLR